MFIWDQREKDIKEFLDRPNNIKPTIKFTMNKEKNKALLFSDTGRSYPPTKVTSKIKTMQSGNLLVFRRCRSVLKTDKGNNIIIIM